MIERSVGLLGIVSLLALAWAASTNRRAVRFGPIGTALGLQLGIALFALRTTWGERVFGAANDLAVSFTSAADAGIEFVFGTWPASVMGVEGEAVALPYVFAIRVLPIVIFMASVFSLLYHYGVLQWVVRFFAIALQRGLRISGAESLATAANVFLGMTEAPLMIRPYVAGLTRSELFCVMTAGLATVAGSVFFAYVGIIGSEYAGHLLAASFMSAPAAIAVAKLMVPEDGTPATLGHASIAVERTAVNGFDAAAVGASDGMRLALNIGAMLIAFVALVALLNAILGWAGASLGHPEVSLEWALGNLLAPVAWLLGVPWSDAPAVGELLGLKTVINEFVAYQSLATMRAELEPRSVVIASYALCGFANFGSLAILIGGLGSIAPDRRSDVARDGLRAIAAGSIATFLTGAIAGLML